MIGMILERRMLALAIHFSSLNPKAEIEAIDRSVADLRTLISVVRERVQPLGRREDEFLG